MLKKLGKVVFALCLLGIIIATIVYVHDSNKSKATNDGHITFIVNNIDNEIVEIERYEYNKGDTLFKIINDNYKLTFDESQYGHYLLGISGKDFSIMTNGMVPYLWLELAYLKDGYTYSDKIDLNNYEEVQVNYGIDGIDLVDNMIFAINEQESPNQTSIFGRDLSGIDNSTTSGSKIVTTIVKIVIICLVIALLIACIVLLIRGKNNKKGGISVRQMSLMSFLTVILFVQETVLSAIPNVQFTFLLISLYACVLGCKRTSIIVFIHVILDNIIWGSLTPIVVLPMFIGYEILILLVHLVRKKNLVLITLMSCLGSLIYCWTFLVANAIFLDIDVHLYFIADIPFEILLLVSTIFTMTYCFRPIEKILRVEWDKITY